MLGRRRFGPRARYWAVAFCLVVCALVPREAFPSASLVGQVTAEGGGAVGVFVNLQLELPTGEVVKQLIAGPDGRFEFHDLTNVVYRLRTSATGFETVINVADFNGPINEINLHVVLPPLKHRKIANPPALSDEQASRRARKEYARGNGALKDNKLDEARRHFENAVQDSPCYARAQTGLALVYVRKENVPAAETALRKSILCDPDFSEAYGWLAMILNGTSRYAESQKVLGEALRRAPDSWNFHYLLGEACSGLNQYEKAKEEYLKVRSLNAAPPAELHARLADLFHKMGNYADAYTEMQAYLSADPRGRFADRTRVLMEEMVAAGLVKPGQIPLVAAPTPKN